MNVQINQLVKTLLQKDSLEQCSVQELQQFANRHPYFGAAQLLLTKKLQTEDPQQYEEQLQKTFLFFHNPLWVEHLLNDTGNATITTPKHTDELADTKEDEKLVNTNGVGIPAGFSSSTNHPQPDTPLPIINAETPLVAEEIEPAHEMAEVKPIDIPATHAAKTELIFEPYHTVDYFASQGIKFKEEGKPQDKFGQQLKSFTDWLKTMKRLPVTELAKAVESNAEQKVEQLAQYSLQEREVMTEAMAEVWEKQGNKLKAIEIYSKLSLLDPSKSRYFAAKIEGLKKIN